MATKTATTERRMRRLDMDAAAREAQAPEGILLVLKGNEYELPAELPIDVFDPFLSDEFDLVELIRTFYAVSKRNEELSTLEAVLAMLDDRPSLVRDFLRVLRTSLETLFGAEQWATFMGARPSVEDFNRIAGGLMDEYGVSLGELFASSASSVNGGATQKVTSESTGSTSDTPESPTTTDG